MAKFVQEHDPKERQILRDIPGRRRVIIFTILEIESRDDKPRPVDRHVNAGDAEKPE